uniref:Uncharacterized protein n=1 Tax=Daphnia magna TaxID=35525 RepID=A0A0P6HVT9_9CRUS
MPLSLLQYFPRIIQHLNGSNDLFLVKHFKVSTVTLRNTHGQYRRVVSTRLDIIPSTSTCGRLYQPIIVLTNAQ